MMTPIDVHGPITRANTMRSLRLGEKLKEVS